MYQFVFLSALFRGNGLEWSKVKAAEWEAVTSTGQQTLAPGPAAGKGDGTQSTPLGAKSLAPECFPDAGETQEPKVQEPKT